MDIILPQPLSFEPLTFSRASIASTRDIAGFHKIVAVNEIRFDYFIDSTNTSAMNGVLIEAARTNYIKNTADSLVPGTGQPIHVQSQVVSLGPLGFSKPSHMILSFFGNEGSKVTVSGGGFIYTLLGKNTSHKQPVYITFPVRASDLQLTVEGTVYAANMEGLVNFGDITDTEILTSMTRPTSWIPTLGSPATRASDVVSNSGLIWSTFIENTPVWDSSISYSSGDVVNASYYRWISTSDNNLGNIPSITSTSWNKVQSVNVLAMIDRGENSTSVIEQGTIGAYFSYVTKIDNPGNFLENAPNTFGVLFDSAAAFEITAKYCELVVSVSTSAGVFTKRVQGDNYSGSLINQGVLRDLYELLSLYFRLEVYHCVVTLRLHNGLDDTGYTLNPESVVSINELVFGTLQTLGKTAYGMRTGIIDYSKRETNEFGVTTFVKRGFSKTMSCSVYVENKDYNRVVETLQSVLAEPTAWIGTDAAEYSNGSLVFGAFKDFNIVISYPTYSMLDIEVQGLVV